VNRGEGFPERSKKSSWSIWMNKSRNCDDNDDGGNDRGKRFCNMLADAGAVE
jgi:hypothetical protein